MASENQKRAVELGEDEFIEKPDAICAHCDQEIFWWPMSHFWSHGTGPNAGLINCHGVHNPSQNIINPGPFAEPKPAAVDVGEQSQVEGFPVEISLGDGFPAPQEEK